MNDERKNKANGIVIWAGVCLILSGCANEVLIDDGSLSIAFCPEFDCENIFENLLLDASESIYCSLYDMSDDVRDLFEEMEREVKIEVIMSHEYSGDGFLRTKRTNHNKFCIVDGRYVLTGSTNPTNNGFTKNKNDILIIESDMISKIYLEEFERIKKGVVSEASERLMLSGIPIEILFCPGCEDEILKIMNYANESILFMTFSFTNHEVSDLILSKDIEIYGVYERTQNSKWSVIEDFNSERVLGFSGGKLHQKTFIIDGEIVVTGSANPTKNGYHNNFENVLVIHSREVADVYLDRFAELYG